MSDIIKAFIDKYMSVQDYTIDDDGVRFKNFKLKDYKGFNIPFIIKEIDSDDVITIKDCDNIRDLKFMPSVIIGNDKRMLIKDCIRLSSLSGTPSNITHLSINNTAIEDFEDYPEGCMCLSCSDCKKLKSLRGLPPKMNTLKINGSVIVNLKYCPETSILDIDDSYLLKSFKGVKIYEILSMIKISKNMPKISWMDVGFDNLSPFTEKNIKSAYITNRDSKIYTFEIVDLYVKLCSGIISDTEKSELMKYVENHNYEWHKTIYKDLKL